MLGTPVILLALAATGLAQAPAPEGYRKVYITSNVNTKFVIVAKARTSGSTTIVQTRNDKPEQQWYIKDGTTKIQLVDSTLCMDGGPQSNWKDMGKVYVNTCTDGAPSQNWVVMGDGRIALEPNPKECIDLEYMRATENNPVGLYACAGLGNTGAADKGINWPLVNVTAPA
ncbi:ricin B lectin domain-containing protein [Chaetomidium leptoderma]|uniref:Ricin B lectin domain-containing protein n=1 Tax=Chaetomidium leptoderma TaxID=669021 RepID=A0AAN6ZSW2_9PEZI|nr:ricin B lectin domain-containing protein [Chaetomidium leptoderma]